MHVCISRSVGCINFIQVRWKANISTKVQTGENAEVITKAISERQSQSEIEGDSEHESQWQSCLMESLFFISTDSGTNGAPNGE